MREVRPSRRLDDGRGYLLDCACYWMMRFRKIERDYLYDGYFLVERTVVG